MKGARSPKYNATDWLTRQQAAEHLGVSIRMLQYFLSHGLLTPEKNAVTRRVRYRFLDVEALRVQRATAWEAGGGERRDVEREL